MGMCRYDYSAGRQPVDDAAVEALIAARSEAMGVARRPITPEEVRGRTRGMHTMHTRHVHAHVTCVCIRRCSTARCCRW